MTSTPEQPDRGTASRRRATAVTRRGTPRPSEATSAAWPGSRGPIRPSPTWRGHLPAFAEAVSRAEYPDLDGEHLDRNPADVRT